MKKMKRLLTAVIAAALVIATIPTALAAGGIFSDVPNGAWYADAVDYVYEHGIMNGTSATTFSPNTPMTRAMLVTVLHRAAGSPSAATGTAFSDVPSGAYYTDAVAWASANGIVTGYGNGRFGSNDPVSRAQIAAILWRYAGSQCGSRTGFCRREQHPRLRFCRRGLGEGERRGEWHHRQPL